MNPDHRCHTGGGGSAGLVNEGHECCSSSKSKSLLRVFDWQCYNVTKKRQAVSFGIWLPTGCVFEERAVGPIRSLDRAARIEAEVEVIVDRLHQFFLLVFEEVIGARDFFVMHGDMLLRT